jgi:predicted ferric reductase
LHYLSIVWAVSICFHAPKAYIFYLIGVPLVIYLADYVVGCLAYCHHLRTLEITRIGTVVEIVWKNPRGFEHDGSGYAYICLPWVSVSQWHAFSIMSHYSSPDYSAVCISDVGDWTGKLHQILRKPTVRPGWVYGPFPNPFSKAETYDNIIAVASGIGITPAISTSVSLRQSRNVAIIWMCREADLLEYYLTKSVFDHEAWTFIFYTGKAELLLEPELLKANHRVRMFSGRPDLERTIRAHCQCGGRG